MKSAVIALGFLLSLSAHAEKIDGKRPVRGVNEEVTIGYSSGVWVSNSQAAKGTQNKLTKTIVPVTESAFSQLESLDKSALYKCLIEKSTVVRHGKDAYWEDIDETFYVISINCK